MRNFKHNTPGLSLDQFIAMKPKELRLGQFFVNSYCKPVDGHWEHFIDSLFYTEDDIAMEAVKIVMCEWQWSTLPEIKQEKK